MKSTGVVNNGDYPYICLTLTDTRLDANTGTTTIDFCTDMGHRGNGIYVSIWNVLSTKIFCDFFPEISLLLHEFNKQIDECVREKTEY